MERDLTDASIAQIAHFYDSPSLWLRANMVISADGHFVDETGSSRSLSSPLDLKVLLTLRAISDAVLVGAATVRKENYKPPVLAGDYKDLNDKAAKLIVVSKSMEFDLSSRLFSQSENKILFATTENESDSWHRNVESIEKIADVLVLPAPLNLESLIDYLHKNELKKIVCEGGPDLLAKLISAGLVDELDITFSKVSIGHRASTTVIHEAIANWPNRLKAKLGNQEVMRIKR